MKVTGIEIAMKVVTKEWIRVTSGWEEDSCATAERAAKESEMIRKGLGGGRVVVVRICSRPMKMACNSAV